MSLSRATQEMSNLNLKVQIKAKDNRGKVIQVVPNVGSQVLAGSVVTLVLG
jgi:beta-lactam-binding protein with PASTA domain